MGVKNVLMNQIDVKDIFRESFLVLTKKITEIVLLETDAIRLNMDEACVIAVRTKGRFHAEIACIADRVLIRAILKEMTHGRKISEDEWGLYIKEYMNIICGNGLTRINNMMKASSRLTVPSLGSSEHDLPDGLEQTQTSDGLEQMQTECIKFESIYGYMKVRLKFSFELCADPLNNIV